jgi:sec-independent protein translocase protein TatB
MFDIGWSEMLVIAVVAFIVIGPKELPAVLRTVASLASKARAAGRVFQQQLDEVMREANAADLRKQVDDALRIDQDAAERAVTGAVDPKGEVNQIWSEASASPDTSGTTAEPTNYTPPAPEPEPSSEPAVPVPVPQAQPPIPAEPTPPPVPVEPAPPPVEAPESKPPGEKSS